MSGYTNTTNLLVPSNAATHCVKTSFVAAPAGEIFNFNQFSLDNFPFNPQAAYFDNTEGTAPLVVTVQGLGFTVTIPEGTIQAANFPAPPNISLFITGAGQVNIFWVDYPLVQQVPGQTVNVNVEGGEIGLTSVNPSDMSVVTVAATSEVLVAANANRKYLSFGAPQTAGIWFNPAGGACGPNLSGCFFLPQGSLYESTNIVNANEYTYYCATAGLVIPVMEA